MFNVFSFDELFLYNGNSTESGVLQTFSGALSNLPMVLEPHGSQMLLRFYSDSGVTKSGFNITYTSSNFTGGKFNIIKIGAKYYWNQKLKLKKQYNILFRTI